MTLDHPNIRQSSYCPLCQLGKDTGMLVCWSCYRRHGMKYGNPDIECYLDNFECQLVAGERS